MALNMQQILDKCPRDKVIDAFRNAIQDNDLEDLVVLRQAFPQFNIYTILEFDHFETWQYDNKTIQELIEILRVFEVNEKVQPQFFNVLLGESLSEGTLEIVREIKEETCFPIHCLMSGKYLTYKVKAAIKKQHSEIVEYLTSPQGFGMDYKQIRRICKCDIDTYNEGQIGDVTRQFKKLVRKSPVLSQRFFDIIKQKKERNATLDCVVKELKKVRQEVKELKREVARKREEPRF